MIDDWQESKLGNVADIYSGYAFKSKEMSSSPEEGVPLVKIKNIFDRKVSDIYDSYLMSDYVLDKYNKYRLIDGDILVAMTGQGSVGRIGKMHRVKKEILVNQRVGIVRVNPDLANKEFVYQQIATTHNESVYFNLAMGAGQPNLSPKDIGNLKIQLPPLPTQRKIAAILSAYDDLIENNLKRIKLLEEKAQLTYEEWFVRMKFPGHENKPIDKETGLPEGWEKKKLGDLIQFRVDNRGRNPKYYTKQGIPVLDNHLVKNSPFVDLNEAKRFLDEDLFENFLRKYLEPKDVLITLVGTVANIALAPEEKCAIIQNTIGLRCNESSNPYFLFWYLRLNKKAILNFNRGSAQPSVKVGDLLSMKLSLPTRLLLNQYKELCGPTFDTIISLGKQNQLLKEARDIMLPRLMSGVIDVEKLDLSGFGKGGQDEILRNE